MVANASSVNFLLQSLYSKLLLLKLLKYHNYINILVKLTSNHIDSFYYILDSRTAYLHSLAIHNDGFGPKKLIKHVLKVCLLSDHLKLLNGLYIYEVKHRGSIHIYYEVKHIGFDAQNIFCAIIIIRILAR